MNKTELLALNSRGLVPGPSEKENAFIIRCDKLLSLKGAPSKKLLLLLKEQYDIAPDWVPISFNRKGLFPWQGGCTTIVYDEENTITTVSIQAPPVPYPLCFLYHPNEIVLHELAHIGRIGFEEPKFEELLTYEMSKHSFRKKIGPLFHELAPYAPIFGVMIGMGATLAPYATSAVTIALTGLLLQKNKKRIDTLFSCIKALSTITSSPKSRYITYRLTDKEIEEFSTLQGSFLTKKIETYLNSDLRWKVIELAYL